MVKTNRTTSENHLPKPGKSPTVKDVARHAGVSYASASRVLTGNTKYSIRPKTRDKILKAGRDLNYLPNPFAQSLRMQRSRIIGLAVPAGNLLKDYTVQDHVMLKLESRLMGMSRNGLFSQYDLMLFLRDDFDNQPLDLFLRKIKLVDGLIYITPIRETDQLLQHISQMCPLVVEGGRPNERYTTVNFDQCDAIVQSVDLMARRGAKSIGMVTSLAHYHFVEDRIKGFLEGLKKQGMEPLRDRIRFAQPHAASSYAGTMDLLKKYPDIDGIIVGKDLQLTGALDALKDLHKNIGEDIRLISLQETEVCKLYHPGLTAVKFDTEELGQRAFELLLAQIEDPDAPPQQVTIPIKINERESTAGIEAASLAEV